MEKLVEREEVDQFLEWAAGVFARHEVAREGGEQLDGYWSRTMNLVETEYSPAGSVRSPDSAPLALRLQFSIEGHFPREWLGGLKVIREWPYASAQKTHAEVTSGPLSGRHLVIEQYATSTNLMAFGPEHLQHDAAFGHDITGEQTGIPSNPHRFKGNKN